LTAQGFTPTTKTLIPYRQQKIFELQFGHYTPFINHVKDRKDTDGMIIAGTYLQYFLHNQHNILID
jgi:hypothetical protein